MDDEKVMERINEIAHEEHQLWEKEGRGDITDAERERLRELGVTSISVGTSCTSDALAAPPVRIPTTRASAMLEPWRATRASALTTRVGFEP